MCGFGVLSFGWLPLKNDDDHECDLCFRGWKDATRYISSGNFFKLAGWEEDTMGYLVYTAHYLADGISGGRRDRDETSSKRRKYHDIKS